jgi:hypothetical protein
MGMICHQPVNPVMNPLERNPMAAFGDLIVIIVVGFVTVAGLRPRQSHHDREPSAAMRRL